MMTTFRKLNEGWNAEPNAPDPRISVVDQDVVISFQMNPFQFPFFTAGDVGRLQFHACSRYHLDGTNDEGWYRGQCRFSAVAPQWGEFYEVGGDLRLADCFVDWIEVGAAANNLRHFLFYFRDETFECDALDWSLVVERPNNELKPTSTVTGSPEIAGDVIFRLPALPGQE